MIFTKRSVFISSLPNNAETDVLNQPKNSDSAPPLSSSLKKKKAAISKEKKEKEKVPQVPAAEASPHHQFISTCVPRKTKTAYAANMSPTWNALVTKAKCYATCPLCRGLKKKEKKKKKKCKGTSVKEVLVKVESPWRGPRTGRGCSGGRAWLLDTNHL